MQQLIDTRRLVLSDYDCAACGHPVVEHNKPAGRQSTASYCSLDCTNWASRHPGQRRPVRPCDECGDTLHPAYSINGKWCSMRCQNRAKMRPTKSRHRPAIFDVLAPPGKWATRAACRDAEAELFFPGKGNPTRPAVAVCDRCPVRRDCLEYALTLERGKPEEAHGVWGGLTAKQRVRLARERIATTLAEAS